jgi:hypothetical protein
MSDTGGKIRTTILLFVVWCVLYVIIGGMSFTYCGSDCNKTRRYTYLVILYLIVFIIIPYYILVNIWGLTKVFVVFMVFITFEFVDKKAQKFSRILSGFLKSS